MAKLIIKDGKGQITEHELTDDVTTLGRSSANIIQVKDSESSRQHCKVEKDGEGFRLIDLGSRNGTRLNDGRVSSQTLRPGDRIIIGKYEITFDAPLTVRADELGATVEVSTLDEKEVKKEAPKPEASGPRYVVEVTQGQETGRTFDLGASTVTLGRHSSNTICLKDEAASNYHAEISKEPIGWVVVDLGSTNGTFVNGEKIVKTPLSTGKEIRIGQTVMVFKNIGAPADDEVFGTVVLDTEMLERELAASERLAKAGWAARIGVGLAAAVLLCGLVLGIVAVARHFAGGGGGTEGNLLRNCSFDEPPDNRGWPPRWRYLTRQPFTWEIDRAADRAERPKETGGALVLHRGEAPISTEVSCEYNEDVTVSPAKGYELSGYVRSEGANGTCGLKVIWKGASRDPEVHYVQVQGSRTDWFQVKRVFRPPSWATSCRAACFSIGNQGKVYFDDVALVETAPPSEPEIRQSYRAIAADFDGRGIARVTSEGRVAASDVRLVLVGQDETAVTDIQLAQGVSVEQLKDSVKFGGDLYELYSTKYVHYALSVNPGREGLELRYDLACAEGTVLKAVRLRMTIEGGFGAADPIFYDAQGRRLEPGASGGASASEILFEGTAAAGAPAPKFAIFLPAEARPVQVTSRGARKEVEVVLAKNLELSKVDTSFLVELNGQGRFERLGVEKALAELEDLVQKRDYAAAYGRSDDIQKEFGSKFPDESAKAAELAKRIDALAAAAMATARTKYDLLAGTMNPQARETANADLKGFLAENLKLYAATKHEDGFKALEVKRQEFEVTEAKKELERKAAELKAQADKFFDMGQLQLSLSFYEGLLTKYPETQVAEQVKTSGVIGLCKGRLQAADEERVEVEKALKEIVNLELNKMWKAARERLISSRAYALYPKNADLTKKLAELDGKIAGDGQ